MRGLGALDALAAADNPLTRRDPRAQLAVALLFVVTVASFERHAVAALLPMALYPVVLASWCRLPPALLGGALALAAPLGLLAGAANPLLEPRPALVLGGVTVGEGWLSLASLALRVAATVSAALLLVAGTGVPRLAGGLHRLGVPPLLTGQLLLLHRYLFVLGGEATRMATAWRLRAGHRTRPALREWGPLVGHLLLRAVDRAERVHQAMLARGHDPSRPLAETTLRWRRADSVYVAGWAAYFVLVRGFDAVPSVGGWLLAPLGLAGGT